MLQRLRGMEPRTCIVIGGGPAGLLAAAHLADAGVRTTLLEAKAGLGGRAASTRHGGFDLNQGPHALYARGAAMRELRALGADPPCWNPASATGSLLVTAGCPHRVPGRPRTLAALARWMTRLGCGTGAEALAGTSTTAWLDRELRDLRARQIAAGLVRVVTFVADHDRLSADVAAGQLRLAWPGVRYVRGGWQRLVDGLAEQAQRRGAGVRTRSAVQALTPEGGGWVVHTDDEKHWADAVVVAVGLPSAATRLLGDLVAAPGPAAEVSALDVGLLRLPRPSRRFAFGTDAPVYLSRHSPPDHPDGVLLSAAGYGALPRAELEGVVDAIQPGWREALSMTPRHLPRMVAVSAIATPQGGGLAGRPPVAVPGAPGAFLAGDWIGPEGWLLDATLASGAAAARAVLAPTGAHVAA